MAAMNMASAGEFSGVSFHLRRCPQGSPLYFARKPPFLVPTIEVRPPVGSLLALKKITFRGKKYLAIRSVYLITFRKCVVKRYLQEMCGKK